MCLIDGWGAGISLAQIKDLVVILEECRVDLSTNTQKESQS